MQKFLEFMANLLWEWPEELFYNIDEFVEKITGGNDVIGLIITMIWAPISWFLWIVWELLILCGPVLIILILTGQV